MTKEEFDDLYITRMSKSIETDAVCGRCSFKMPNHQYFYNESHINLCSSCLRELAHEVDTLTTSGHGNYY